MYLKLDNSKKENIALKENNSENIFKLGALKVKTEKQHNMSDLLKKEVQLGKEENKKLRALCNKNVDDLVKMNKELTVLARVGEKKKQEIYALKAQAFKDEGKYEEMVQNMEKSFEKDRKEATSLRSKFEEEERKSQELAAKHKLFVEKLSDKLECPVCLEVPRAGPVPVCPNGHFVCKSARRTPVPRAGLACGMGNPFLLQLCWRTLTTGAGLMIVRSTLLWTN